MTDFHSKNLQNEVQQKFTQKSLKKQQEFFEKKNIIECLHQQQMQIFCEDKKTLIETTPLVQIYFINF